MYKLLNREPIFKEYKLLIPTEVKKDELLKIVEDITGKNIIKILGSGKHNYVIILPYKDSTLHLDVHVSDSDLGTLTTSITQLIGGFSENGKYFYNCDPEDLISLSKYFKGLLLVRSNTNQSIPYTIGYDKDSFEYKLLNYYLERVEDDEEAFQLFAMLLRDKSILSGIFATSK